MRGRLEAELEMPPDLIDLHCIAYNEKITNQIVKQAEQTHIIHQQEKTQGWEVRKCWSFGKPIFRKEK